MKNTIIERLKSPVVWATVIAQIVLIIGVVNPNIASEVKVVCGAFLEIFTAFGILNNPAERDEF